MSTTIGRALTALSNEWTRYASQAAGATADAASVAPETVWLPLDTTARSILRTSPDRVLSAIARGELHVRVKRFGSFPYLSRTDVLEHCRRQRLQRREDRDE